MKPVVIVRHGHNGCPIEVLVVSPGVEEDAVIAAAEVTPMHALQLAMLLTEFATKELSHERRNRG